MDREHPTDDDPSLTPTTPTTPRKLPSDLPTSLDDRRVTSSYGGETEFYDAWQGRTLFYQNAIDMSLSRLTIHDTQAPLNTSLLLLQPNHFPLTYT